MTTELKVAAVMTAPRHEIVLARNYIEIALRDAGIPLHISGGVFYGQCMQRMMEDMISKSVDVLVTVDFDSLFIGKDVSRLLSKLVNSDFDAVAAMQCRRGKRFPLMTLAGKTKLEIDWNPFQVSTAHFGLTCIDLHKLKDVPKPWFWSQPDERGEWSPDKIDDDIWFWRQWEKAGLTVAVDPETRIGHLEEMCVMMDEQMNPVHCYPSEWADQAYNPKTGTGTLVVVGPNYPTEDLERLCEQHERSFLFEPLPEAAETLRQTVGRMPGVEVIEAACAESSGRRQFNLYNEFGMSSSLGTVTAEAREAFCDFDLSKQGEVTVDVINLCHWLEERGIEEIETLKIDAQGMDFAILKTLEPYLLQDAISEIQLEADGEGFRHYDGLPDNSEEAIKLWMTRFPFDQGRLKQRRRIQPDLTFVLNKEAACPA